MGVRGYRAALIASTSIELAGKVSVPVARLPANLTPVAAMRLAPQPYGPTSGNFRKAPGPQHRVLVLLASLVPQNKSAFGGNDP